MTAGRLEAFRTVPSAVTVAATNASGGPTTVTLTAGSYSGTTSMIAQFARDLNLTRPNLNYPLTAAKTAAYIGYGTWTAGYLFNEASGNLAATFGTQTLTATSLTYGNAGPRSTLLGDTTDKAVGFDASGDQADGSTAYDVTTGDLCVAFTCKFASAPSTSTVISKVAAAFASGWGIYCTATNISLGVSAGSATSATVALPIGVWFACIAVMDRGVGKIQIAVQELASGTQTISTAVTASGNFTTAATFRLGNSLYTGGPSTMQLGAMYIGTGASAAANMSTNLGTALTNFCQAINAGWTVTLSTGSSGTGKVTIDSTAPLTESASRTLTWSTTEIRDLLGFTADLSAGTTSTTSTKQARGLWLPGVNLMIDSDPKRAPLATDHRATRSPRGNILGRVGNTSYRHRNLRYSHVANTRAWESEATIANSGWDTFYKETQLGLSSSWFTPSSKLLIYYDAAGVDAVLGADLNSGAGPTAGWGIAKPMPLDEIAQSVEGWTGMVRIVLGDVESTG